jgi:hypothetical protein
MNYMRMIYYFMRKLESGVVPTSVIPALRRIETNLG